MAMFGGSVTPGREPRTLKLLNSASHPISRKCSRLTMSLLFYLSRTTATLPPSPRPFGGFFHLPLFSLHPGVGISCDLSLTTRGSSLPILSFYSIPCRHVTARHGPLRLSRLTVSVSQLTTDRSGRSLPELLRHSPLLAVAEPTRTTCPESSPTSEIFIFVQTD
ncbi:hypothetical protein J6590_069999 [Homalodisca vitripennis]|nr:hypothetical protein J6590_069999 [Homalodisca vitripennis]